MADVPKIVQDRLRAAVPESPHPDADVLTAFAEQALSPGEREDVVRHLARCGDCREVVALSIPPMEAVAQPEMEQERTPAAPVDGSDAGWRNWLAWPNLRWAAWAAAVVVVGSVLILRPGKHESMVERVNQQAANAPPPAPSNAKSAAPLDDEVTRSEAVARVKPDSALVGDRQVAGMMKSQPSRAQTQTPPVPSNPLLESKRPDSLERKYSYSLQTDKLAEKVPAAPAAGAQGGIAPSEPLSHSSQETVVVTGAANAVQAVPMNGRAIVETESAAIEKAKPAAKEEARLKAGAVESDQQNKLAATYSSSDMGFALRKAQSKQSKDVAPQWSLAQGILRRSLDGGATWQIALQLEHPLLSFGPRGNDVWAGGQAGTLFHSVDGGATWTLLQPSTKTGSLTADIVAIQVRSEAAVVLTTSNGESWTSTDAGKTWEKK